MRCPNCNSDVRPTLDCEVCGAPLPHAETAVRVEGPRQRAARRGADGTAANQTPKKRGGTLGDFFGGQGARATGKQPDRAAPRRGTAQVTRTNRADPSHDGGVPVPARYGPPRDDEPAPHLPQRMQQYANQQTYQPPAEPADDFYQTPLYQAAPDADRYADATGNGQSYGEHSPAPHFDNLQAEDGWEAGYAVAWGATAQAQRDPALYGAAPDDYFGAPARTEGVAEFQDFYAPPSAPAAGREHALRMQQEQQAIDREWGIISEPSDSRTMTGSRGSRGHYVPRMMADESAHFGSAPRLAPVPLRSPFARIFASVSRLTFNVIVVALVLLILAIPVLIGVQKLVSLHTPGRIGHADQTLVPTAVPPTGFSSYADATFSIAYPGTWQHGASSVALGRTTPSHVETFSANDGALVQIGTGQAVPADQLQQDLDDIARHAYSGGVPEPVATGVQKTYGGGAWLENDYTLTQVRGNTQTQMTLRALEVDHGATTYFILMTAPTATFAATNASAFEPMLNAFRFHS